LDLLSGSSASQTVIASPGSRVHFTLPDQTEVWLNSGSTLEFPLNLNQQDQRKVKLFGQGYFNVKHDANHPFYVETEILSVKALGTSFDVSSYSEDQQISSTLEEGSIALFNSRGNEVARLFPGQKAVLDKKTNEIVVKNVETALSTSWKDGKLIFRNTSLSDVTIQLERWFNCKIHLDPHLLNSDLMYSATIQDETLGEVLKMIEISTRIKTKIEKREVYINSKN
jgi:transmembrane sensor